ncbi:MAG TPA: hypothetical protein VGS23_05860 [Thermoplasmata archaeon]|nr:hypothetical protein [Thermoplasmata archaeon]
MGGFRGSDEALDREIETLERIGRVRLRRASEALQEVDRDLRALRKERARRRASTALPEPLPEPTGASA